MIYTLHMEAIQAYYLYKSSIQTAKMPTQTRTETIKKIAISWALEAMKNVLGYEDVRNAIIKTFFPQIENAEEMRTFDAFQQYETPPFIDKAMEITDYCEDIIEDDQVKGIVVMTAANIQDSAKDRFTHYQSFIIDKHLKRVYAIDPASKENGVGIYEAAITETVVLPIFRAHDYACNFVSLTHPAQTNKGDVFCQTWTLVILLKALEKMYKHTNKYIGVIDIPAPRPKIKKYQILLDFYKDILRKVPDVKRELGIEYLGVLNANKAYISEHCKFEKIVDIDVCDLFLSMIAEEIMD
jgi:hypothetical protein